jgi:hypothetical protein
MSRFRKIFPFPDFLSLVSLSIFVSLLHSSKEDPGDVYGNSISSETFSRHQQQQQKSSCSKSSDFRLPVAAKGVPFGLFFM